MGCSRFAAWVLRFVLATAPALATGSSEGFMSDADRSAARGGEIVGKYGRGARVDDKYVVAFKEFVQRYDKSYSSEADRELHFAAFKASYDYIEEHNAEDNSSQLGITFFADMTSKEFAARFSRPTPPTELLLRSGWKDLGEIRENTSVSLPKSVDWRTRGAVSKVKDQKLCGGCWAFSTTGALEGAWHIATGQLLSLSEQQFIDCSSGGPPGEKGNKGCEGGSPGYADMYAENNAICSEGSYPYNAATGTCQDSCSVAIVKGGIIGMHTVSPGNEMALMQAVSRQPISIAVEADQDNFKLYKSGILKQKCGANVDHGVLLVGYGTDNGQDYWIVKNSWGAQWGENGYVRILRGAAVNEGAGLCGVLVQAFYPVVDGDKALWWYNVPWGWVFIGIFIGGACIVGLCFLVTKKMRRRRGGAGDADSARPLRQAGAPVQFFSGSGQRLGSGATLPPNSVVPTRPAAGASNTAPTGVPAGNSRASRLLLEAPSSQIQVPVPVVPDQSVDAFIAESASQGTFTEPCPKPSSS